MLGRGGLEVGVGRDEAGTVQVRFWRARRAADLEPATAANRLRHCTRGPPPPPPRDVLWQPGASPGRFLGVFSGTRCPCALAYFSRLLFSLPAFACFIC